MSSEQVDKLAELREEHFRNMQGKLAEIMKLKKQLMESAFLIKQDPELTDSLASSIGKLQSEIEITTHTHFSEITKLCGEENLPKLRQLMKEILGPPERGRLNRGTLPPPRQ